MSEKKPHKKNPSTKASKKVAVILFNLGGPTGPDTIAPFLKRFFLDRNIIHLPYPLRWLLASLISFFRSRGEAREVYGEMGGSSPLLENTEAQRRAIEDELKKRLPDNTDLRTWTCMQYWHPMAESIAPQVQAFQPDQVVLLSLYPQFSTTTFRSSLQAWEAVSKKIGFHPQTSVICCYPEEAGFIAASAEKVKEKISLCQAETGRDPRVLFSAHSLPESYIKAGDPYVWQCENTVKAIADKAGLDKNSYRVCYQSKVGPQKWVGPQTEDEIERAGEDGVPIIVYPHAFVSEHVETIVELGIEYREVAEEAGAPWYDVVETVGTHPSFISGLSDQIMHALERSTGVKPGHPDGHRICPKAYGDCCQKTFKATKNGLSSQL